MLFWAWFRATRLGITIQATGSNEKSAFLSGVSITRVNVVTYGLSGLFAAGAALYLTTQTGAGSPTIGKDYILPSVAAAVIGGVSLFGGRGHLAGTLIGAFILTLIGNLVFVLNVSSYWQPVVSGVILLLSVLASSVAEKAARGARGMNAFLARNRLILLAYAGMVVLLLVTALFSPGFLSASNLRSTVVLAAFVGIVALGQTFVIIGGGIDLSIPWVLNSAAIIMALLCGGQDAAARLGRAAGARRRRTDRADQRHRRRLFRRAADHHDARRQRHPAGPDPGADRRLARRLRRPALIKFLSVGRIGPFPVIALIWLVLTLVATLLLSKAAFGRHLYALGTSATVAEFSGVPTARTTVLTYVISGLTAALAGMLLTGYSGQAYLGMGDAYLFTSIAAVAIGGASILGGSGHYLGTVAGALVLTILTGLLPALNLSSGALLVVYGAVILITVSIGSEVFAGIGGRLRAGKGKEEA